MKPTGVSSYKLLFSVITISVLSMCVGAFPTNASALEVVSRTQQVLPLNVGNNCAQASISNFTPFVYDGAINSFEFTVSDSSYVSLVASVGNTSIPFNYMTRFVLPSGAVRIHVDMETMPISGTTPINVLLLSARSGAPVCLTSISTTVGSGPSVVITAPAVTTPVVQTPVVTTPKPWTASPSTSATPTSTASTATPGSAATATVTGAASPLKGLCSSEASAYRLWLILLIIFALVVGGLLWAEFPMSWTWASTPERIATIILALLVILLGFWYFSTECRAALWMPLLAFLIALLGLLAAFWNHPRVTQMLLIQETKKSSNVIVTPPPKR